MPTMNLAGPGTAYGPCLGECSHPRCARSRRTASLICPRCDNEIGYGTDYVKEDGRNGRLVHVACPVAEPVTVCCSCGRHHCICDFLAGILGAAENRPVEI